jgi:hypothetical protein
MIILLVFALTAHYNNSKLYLTILVCRLMYIVSLITKNLLARSMRKQRFPSYL